MEIKFTYDTVQPLWYMLIAYSLLFIHGFFYKSLDQDISITHRESLKPLTLVQFSPTQSHQPTSCLFHIVNKLSHIKCSSVFKWCVSFSIMFSGFIDIAALINNLFLNILLNVESFDHFIPQFLPDPPLFLYPHNFVFSLFSLNPSSVLPIYSWVCGHSPDMVDLTGN